MTEKITAAVVCVLTAMIFLAPGCSGTKTYKVYEGDDLSAGQVARLRIPIYMDVHSVDREKIGGASTFFRTGDMDLELAPGRHVVVVKYNDIWDVTDEYHEKVQSEPAALEFLAEAGKTYLICMDEPENMVSAQLYASDFKPWIEEAETGEKLEPLPADQKAEVPAPEETPTTGPAETQRSAAPPVSDKAPVVTQTEEDVSPLEMLRFWWKRASTEGRKGFMEWIVAAPAPGRAEADPRAGEEPDVSALDMLKFWWGKAGGEERTTFMEGLVD